MLPQLLLLAAASIAGRALAAGGDALPYGPTFGSGLAGVSICAAETTVLNHTLSAGGSPGVLRTGTFRCFSTRAAAEELIALGMGLGECVSAGTAAAFVFLD